MNRKQAIFLLLLYENIREVMNLVCYHCYRCDYILENNTTSETCNHMEGHCVAVKISGLTINDEHGEDIHRLCANPRYLYNHTLLKEDNWEAWIKTFCDEMNVLYEDVTECKQRHCIQDHCNTWTKEEMDVTVARENNEKQEQSTRGGSKCVCYHKMLSVLFLFVAYYV